MRNILRVNRLEGVLEGAIAVCDIKTDRRLYNLKLHATGTDAADKPLKASEIIEWTKFIVNSIEQRRTTSADLLEIAQRNQMHVPDDVVPIYFAEPWRATVIGEEIPSWDLAGQNKATLEIKVAKGVKNLRVWIKESGDYGRNAEFDANGKNPKPLLAIVRQLPLVWNAPAGEFDLSGIQTRYPIQRVILTPSAGAVESVEVVRDGEKVFEATASENAANLADYKQTVVPGTFPVVFDYEQQISSALRVEKTLDFKVKLSQPCILRALVEYTAPSFA